MFLAIAFSCTSNLRTYFIRSRRCLMSLSTGLKIQSHVWVYGVEVGRAREGVRPPANGKQGNRFSTWVQSGIRFAPCTEGHPPKTGIFAFRHPARKYHTLYIIVQYCI
jgi:hypothetical protein